VIVPTNFGWIWGPFDHQIDGFWIGVSSSFCTGWKPRFSFSPFEPVLKASGVEASGCSLVCCTSVLSLCTGVLAPDQLALGFWQVSTRVCVIAPVPYLLSSPVDTVRRNSLHRCIRVSTTGSTGATAPACPRSCSLLAAGSPYWLNRWVPCSRHRFNRWVHTMHCFALSHSFSSASLRGFFLGFWLSV
jgi:hypothetical protein